MSRIDSETKRIVDANSAACTYYGYTVDEIKRKLLLHQVSRNIGGLGGAIGLGDGAVRCGENSEDGKDRKGDES